MQKKINPTLPLHGENSEPSKITPSPSNFNLEGSTKSRNGLQSGSLELVNLTQGPMTFADRPGDNDSI